MKISFSTRLRRALIMLFMGYVIDALLAIGWAISSLFEAFVMSFDRQAVQMFFNRYQPQYVFISFLH